MSGHSKWSSIKHKKAAADARRGKIFTKLIKEITVAARLGGGDPGSNARLRAAITDAKAANMPADNIKRAIQKGTGELPGVSIEEVVYEGYGPGGVAIYVEAMTDNKNRTTPEIRHLFGKHGGHLGESNSVSWMFAKKGYFVIQRRSIDEESLMETVLEAGAEDMRIDGENYEVFTDPGNFEAVKMAVEKKGIPVEVSQIAMIPQNRVRIEGKKTQQLLGLLEILEDHDDVQHVFANFDIDESEIVDES
ncbi:MAG: YebC/PmpR family DNA-binding transcriptional regulator [Acidobacteriota bacterium]